jgi:hypothetical protein
MARVPRMLLAVLVAGAGLRLALLLSYSPANLAYPDVWGYVKAADGPLFMDNWIRPAGYPAVLVALHAISGSLTFTIVVQHALGLLTAALAYFTVLRLGAPRLVALVPAIVLAIGLDHLYFEHTLLSETVFTLTLFAALYATARGLEPGADGPRLPWLAAAGLLLGLAVTVRTAALFVVPVFLLAALLALPRPWARRLGAAAAVAGGAAVVCLAYAAVQSSQNGFFGLAEGGGWATYARVAPFADCRTFTPPAGTAGLCESSDTRTRPGPDFYAWDPASPARRLFGGPPANAAQVGAFGRAVIEAQPKAYASAVLTDLWRYVDAGAGRDRPQDGGGPDDVAIVPEPGRYAEEARANREVAGAYYGPVRTRVRGAARTLTDAQSVLRVHGAMVLAALLLALVALPLADRRRRIALLLLGGTAVLPVVVATATTLYNWRYLVPFDPLLMAAGALGVAVLAERVQSRRRNPETARQENLASAPSAGMASTRSRTQSTA